jgi:hypothetical protein
MDIAKTEAPDMTVSLHSHENTPRILLPSYVPWFLKERTADLRSQINMAYKKAGLANAPEEWFGDPSIEDKEFPPRTSYNLISALHHVSGTMSFTFECSHGTVSDKFPEPIVTHNDILDIQLLLYEGMFDYILENRLFWE